MKKKILYEAPEMEQISLKLERCVIMGSDNNTQTPIDEGDENF